MKDSAPTPNRAAHVSDRWILAGLVLLAAILYGPTVGYELLNYDDRGYILENPLLPLQDWDGLKTLFGEYYFAQYSPFQILSYAVDYAIAGPAPWIYHLHNVLYFAGTVALIYVGLRRSLPQAAAGAATLLWTVHPVHVEVVSWAAERKGVMSLFYVGAAFVALGKGLDASGAKRRAGWFVFGLLLWQVGAFSKATVVPTGFLIFAYFLMIEKQPLRSLLPAGIPMAILTLLTIAVTLQGDPNPHETTLKSEMYGGGWLSSLRIMIPIWIDYWRCVLWPTGLELRYLAADMGTIFHPRILISAVGLGAMTVGAIYSFFRGRRRWAYTFAGFYVFLSPVAGIFPINFFQADRYLHGPLLFPCVLAGLGYLGWSRTQPKKAMAILAGVALGGSILTVNYHRAWSDSESLWRNQLGKNRFEITYYINLASTLWEQERFDEAGETIQAGLEVFPEDGWLLYYRAMAADRLGDLPNALPYYQQALDRDPTIEKAARRIGEIYFHRGQPAEAANAFQAAIRALEGRPTVHQPSHYGQPDESMGRAYLNLGAALEQSGRLGEAKAAWRRGLEYQPDAWELINPLALTAYREGESEKWADWMERSLAAHPNQPNAAVLDQLVQAYRQTGQRSLER